MVDIPITREMYLEWRSPREAQANPTLMNNPVWQWLVRSRMNAWQVNEKFSGPSAFKAGPTWCCDRFGQSETILPDGRTVLIAGEHEDHYDPDFYIYNDVIVIHPDDTIDIYGYPKEDFPPTDFHSATLVGDKIILIGSLGYNKQRLFGSTQVLALNLNDFSISKIATTGENPGWIHGHQAILCDEGKSILITKGEVDRGEDKETVENIDDWSLNLTNFNWRRKTKRNWLRWCFKPANGDRSYLFELRSLVFSKKWDFFSDEDRSRENELLEKGLKPDFDALSVLYQPDIIHEQIPDNEDEYDTHRIGVQGVVVRYVETFRVIIMTVEGDLSADKVDFLRDDLLNKLTRAEGVPWKAELVQD